MNFALILLLMLASYDRVAVPAGMSDGCKQIAQKNFKITEPGTYCLAGDLHTRLSFADHPAEHWLIFIDADGVTLDLNGNLLGRGRMFRQPGGNAIELGENARNVVVKNGVLRDFETGIYRPWYSSSGEPKDAVIVTPHLRSEGELCVDDGNICVKNVRFLNVAQPFRVRGRPANSSPTEQRSNINK